MAEDNENDNREEPEQSETGEEDRSREPGTEDATGEDIGVSEREETEARAPPTGSDEPLMERLLAFNPGDWLVIVLVFLLVGIAVVSYVPLNELLPGGQQTTASPELVAYCEETAAAVEANATLPQGTTCDCVPPGTFDERRFSVSEKVDNATELFLVSCTLPNDQDFIFPVRRVNNESINASQEFPNRTVVN